MQTNPTPAVRLQKYLIKNGLVRATVVGSPASGGYRYMPLTTAHRCGRKKYATPEDAFKGRITGSEIIEARNFKEANEMAQALNGTFQTT